MGSARDGAALPAPGCPIRESTGHRPFNTSPWLIAVVHALLRLLVPRHPPCALRILTVIRSTGERLAPSGVGGSVIPRFVWPTVRFSRSGEGTARGDSAGWSLKAQQRARAARATRPSGPVDVLGPPASTPGAEAPGAVTRRAPQRELP